ncbi:MAG: phage tail tube protein [Chloroflexota bacterium]|nr:phage tail tube protein [Chloroflexota bacterium]
MANIIGRLMSVGLGKETTRGTAVAPSYWIPQTEFSVMDRDEKILDESALGRIEQTHDGDKDHQWAEGSISGIVRDQSFGLILLAAFGQSSSALKGTETTVYNHTFTVANTNTHPSLTIAAKDANEDVRSALGMLSRLELSAELGSYLTYTADFIATKSAAATNTVSYLTENKFRPGDITLKIADTVANLGAATATQIRNFTLTIEKNAEPEYALGTTNIVNIFNKEFTTSMSFSALYGDTTLKDLVFGGAKRAMSITITRSDVTIGAGSNPSLVFTFQPGFFQSWEKDGGLDDILTQNIEFTGLYSTSQSAEISAVLTNTAASY